MNWPGQFLIGAAPELFNQPKFHHRIHALGHSPPMVNIGYSSKISLEEKTKTMLNNANLLRTKRA